MSTKCLHSISALFDHVASTYIPAAWNTLAITPVHKKGDPTLAKNYRSIWVMGPFAKLFMSCINRYLTSYSEINGLRAPTQAGFRPKHRREDLALALDLAIDRARATRKELALAFIDLEKAFDRVPRDKLMHVLLYEHGLPADIVEVIRRFYTDVFGRVVGDDVDIGMTSGVK